ncbi:MAG: hypothetical protein RJA58_725 [Pseudomonadota bacterium]|jgi:nitronate monooxygenase
MLQSQNTHAESIADQLISLAQGQGIRPWKLNGKTLVPVVQGGMGVGVSASGLAGSVARLGAMGTLSSVDLRRRHPDLMAITEDAHLKPNGRELMDAANREALTREIHLARDLAEGRGLIAVNVMKALSAYEQYVETALAAGIWAPQKLPT